MVGGSTATSVPSPVSVYLPACGHYSAIPAAQQKPWRAPLPPPAYVPLHTDTSAECDATRTGSPPEREGSAPQTPPVTKHLIIFRNVPLCKDTTVGTYINYIRKPKKTNKLINVLRKLSAELFICYIGIREKENNLVLWSHEKKQTSKQQCQVKQLITLTRTWPYLDSTTTTIKVTEATNWKNFKT